MDIKITLENIEARKALSANELLAKRITGHKLPLFHWLMCGTISSDPEKDAEERLKTVKFFLESTDPEIKAASEKLLLETQEDFYGLNAIHRAVSEERLNCIAYLLEKYPQLYEQKSQYNAAPLHYADNPEIIEYLCNEERFPKCKKIMNTPYGQRTYREEGITILDSLTDTLTTAIGPKKTRIQACVDFLKTHGAKTMDELAALAATTAKETVACIFKDSTKKDKPSPPKRDSDGSTKIYCSGGAGDGPVVLADPT